MYESTYLFIVLHKHSIWHFLTFLPKFFVFYKSFHICIIFPHTYVHERLFVVCKFMVNFGIEFSARWVFASMNIPIRSPFHTPIYTNLQIVKYEIFKVLYNPFLIMLNYSTHYRKLQYFFAKFFQKYFSKTYWQNQKNMLL
jgi:hypothetical protein